VNEYLANALSGWAGVLLFGSGLMMPYLLRRVSRAKTPYLRRLWPHYWLGYLALLFSSAHAWLAMRSGNMRGIDSTGVWIATIALLIMLWQIAVGFMLKDPTQSNRRTLRRIHFWAVTSVAGFIVVHIALNRP